MSKYLRFAAGVSGLVAALLWFLASRVQPAPAVTVGYSVVPNPEMPFYRKWRMASNLNQWAAGVTGFSVLLTSLSEFFPNC
jgi:hypothetical protein